MTQHAQMVTEVYLDVQTAVRGNFWALNLFEMLYPRLEEYSEYCQNILRWMVSHKE